MTTSSTSSSDPRDRGAEPAGGGGPAAWSRGPSWARLPWAGVLAVVLLLVGDHLAFGFRGPWQCLPVDDPNSAAGTRLALKELVAEPADRPRVVAVGTSRVLDGFDLALARRLLPGAAVAKLTYPRFEPFAILALVPDLLASGADAVLLIASEQDTHRPLRLEPVPGSSTASLGALWTLLGVTDWRFAVDNRTALYRLVGTSVLGLYRYRPDIQLTGLVDRRRFELNERIPDLRPKEDPFRPVSLWGAERNPVSADALRQTWDLFPPLTDPWNARIQAGVVQEITRGPHVPVQMDLYRRAVQRLREAGIVVVILQGVMHPAADDLYDTSIQSEFLAFAQELGQEFGVHFVPRTRMPLFAESDFYDLVHTNQRGAAKITRTMARALRQTSLAPRLESEPGA